MRLAESRDLAGIVHVQQEVDIALGIAADVFRLVRADMGKAHFFKQICESLGIRPGEFDELEAVEAHGIFGSIGSHGIALQRWFHMILYQSARTSSICSNASSSGTFHAPFGKRARLVYAQK